jgi:AcrR family transcriptional regulator
MEAALDIISSEGIQNLTIKTLSEKIGVTEGAIYRHFTSKAEILGTIADMFKDSSTEILDTLVATKASGLEKVKVFFLGRLRQFSESPGLTLVMFSENIFKTSEGFNKVDMEKRSHETIQSHQKLLVQSIKQSQQEGEIVSNIPPQHVFMMVIGALRLLVTRWRGAKFSFDLQAEGQKLWKSIETLIASANKTA